MDHDYPMHELSPKMSLDHYDAVFLGEVAVATRRCTLGFCAGIRVVDKVKGVRGKTLLVQVKPAAVADAGVVPGKCLPDRFRVKGERWLVFGHYGTSAAGTSYLRAEEDGPSYLTAKRPDFNALEGRYLMMRAKLDHAIEERLR
jgi:hypothetical protein